LAIAPVIPWQLRIELALNPPRIAFQKMIYRHPRASFIDNPFVATAESLFLRDAQVTAGA
jgi:hypothetical protein